MIYHDICMIYPDTSVIQISSPTLFSSSPHHCRCASCSSPESSDEDSFCKQCFTRLGRPGFVLAPAMPPSM